MAVDDVVGPKQATTRPVGRRYLRALARDNLALVCACFLVLLVMAAVFAPIVAPYNPLEQNLLSRNLPPFSAGGDGQSFHVLGTDELGRDLLSRLIFGARVSLSVGVIGALFSGVVGVGLGLIAGYYRGWVDDVVMRAVDAMMALPTLLIALFVLFLIGGGFANLILIFALVRWMIYARLTRGITLSLRESAFVAAARAVGCRNGRIIRRHILPNIYPPILVLFTLEVAILILAEAALSFLGFGIQPPESSWGLMIARGRDYVRSAWWLVTIPGLVIFVTTISLNLVATWVRNVTDPGQQWRWMKPGMDKGI